jgi:hypothetical protein
MQVTMVPKEFVGQCWDDVEKYLADAAEYTHGRYEVDDILDSITDYDHTLWIAFDEEKIKGAVVTNFMHYPKKKYLCMTFCGGVELDKWKDPMLKLLQHFAHDTNCDGIEATARLGWTKIFKDDGHKPLWQTFQLPAAEAGLGAQNG